MSEKKEFPKITLVNTDKFNEVERRMVDFNEAENVKKEATTETGEVREASQDEYEKALRENPEYFKDMEAMIYDEGDLDDAVGEKKNEIIERVGIPSKKDRDVQEKAIEDSLSEIGNDLGWVLKLKAAYNKDDDAEMRLARIGAIREQLEGFDLEKRISSFDYKREKDAAALYATMLEIKRFIEDEEDELEKKAA